MGGWITLFGDISDFDHRLRKFRETFTVEGVPNLRVEVYEDSPEMKTFCWAWNIHKVPDVFVEKQGDSLLILCGVITNLGQFGPPSPTQHQTAKHILELWLKHGEKVIEELNGSFSCLFFNQKTKQVSIFTDRFASRSVWMVEERRTWIIGNFPSAVASVQRNKPKIDPVGLWSLFHTSRHLGGHGLYHNIHTLLAGQRAVLAPGHKASITRWWERKYQPENHSSPVEWGQNLAEALITSARRYKKVSKSPYLFLSGGIDSRIVAAAFKRPLKTLTLCSAPNTESRIASLVSKTIGLEHQTIVRSPNWYLDTMEASALISSGNYLTSHAHFIIPAKDISAQYPNASFFLGDFLESLNKHYFHVPKDNNFYFSPKWVPYLLRTCVPFIAKNFAWPAQIFKEHIAEHLQKYWIDVVQDTAQKVLDVSEDDHDRFDTYLRWIDVSVTYTYNMITCLWPFAGERNLFFDNDLNELSLKIPAELRGAGILHKWILYNFDRKLLLIPDANDFLPPFFPNSSKELVKKIRPIVGKLRRKLHQLKGSEPVLRTSGSWLLLHEMYRKDPRYKELIENIFTDKTVFPSEIFNLEHIKKIWEKYLAGNINLHFEIEALLSFGTLHKLIPFNGINL